MKTGKGKKYLSYHYQSADTNFYIDKPKFAKMVTDAGHVLILPFRVHAELNKVKDNYRKIPSVRRGARIALKNIKEAQDKHQDLVKYVTPDWDLIKSIANSVALNPSEPDDEIIASVLTYKVKFLKQEDVLLFWNHDAAAYSKAKTMMYENEKPCLFVQEWEEDKGLSVEELKTPIIELSRDVVKDKALGKTIPVDVAKAEIIPVNGGVLIKTVDGTKKYISHAAIRKNGKLNLLSQETTLFGISQYLIADDVDSEKFEINWEHVIALNTLADTSIKYHTFTGQAGTGKTCLALAAACQGLETGRFKKVYITRSPVSFGESLGFAKGSINQKMKHWVLGMLDNVRVLKKRNPQKAKMIDEWLNGKPQNPEEPKGKRGSKGPRRTNETQRSVEDLEFFDEDGGKKIVILSFEHLRGRNLEDCCVIVDEGQNINRNEMLTVVTRLGENSIMIIAGDLDQIDSKYLTATRNGLVWFIKVMRGDEVFSHVNFQHVVRSKAVKAFLRRLKAFDGDDE